LEISLKHTGGARFTAEARHHRVLLDQPAEDGATDQGMSPAELLLASLGGCVGQHVSQYLSLRGLSSEGLSIRVTTEPPPRTLHFGDFHVEVLAPGLSDSQLRAIEKSFPGGLVQNALRENSVRVTATASHEPGGKS
jgi:putative redox protein